jgi:hypothetical protein
MEKQALLHAAELLEKNAGAWGTVLDKLRSAWGSATKAYNSKPVQNTLEGVGGLAGSLGGKAYDKAYNMVGSAGGHIREGLFGKGIRSGYGKLRDSVSGGAVNQELFNQGLAELAKGVGRTGAVYGGGLYAGSKLLGGGQPQEPYYYG